MHSGTVVALELQSGSPLPSEIKESTQGVSITESPDIYTPKAQTFDLFNLVISFKRIEIFLEPVTDAWEMIKYLLRWRTPVFSLLCCFTLNVIFLTLNEVAWFSFSVLCISTPAVLGYLQECGRGSLPEQQLQRRKHYTVERQDLKTVRLTRQEALLEVKGILRQLEDILSRACFSAVSVYRVLYWEDHSISFLFYGGLLTLVSLLYLVPFSWVLAAGNTALFLWNKDFWRVVLEHKECFHQSRLQPTARDAENKEPEPTLFVDHTPTPTSVEDHSPGSFEEAEEAEPDDEFKDAIEEDDDVPPGVGDLDLGMADNGLLSRNEPIRSKVSKLTEKLRKRYPANNYVYCTYERCQGFGRRKNTVGIFFYILSHGNCSSCNAVFSVLKKRRNCSNCGNSFCARCCSCKVPRSSMGATAPEAQRETVFVCNPCNQTLSKKE
ncbi:protrudin isoform X2 [Polypterus senegalus]|uniref:protrudin isoform X2 n=1 Tax=Polypterus senegalus TaxID=55291 RepID=UPI00196262F9|nr:protrudin isoform X2 [Polypterus senegalus]